MYKERFANHVHFHVPCVAYAAGQAFHLVILTPIFTCKCNLNFLIQCSLLALFQLAAVWPSDQVRTALWSHVAMCHCCRHAVPP